MRLDKFLADFGIGTRKQIKEYVKNGRCKVNGNVVQKSDIRIDENADTVSFDDNDLIYSRFHYFMLYKPVGVVSATTDGKNKTVLDLLKHENVKNLSPCGRLDIDTAGLLLLTDDGQLIHELLSPKKHVDKVYEAHIAHDLTQKDISRLESGVDIGDKDSEGKADMTLPALVSTNGHDSKSRPIVLLTIHEGRFHQVKRMFEAVGNEVMFLKRLSMGSLKLDESLKPGEYRSLTEKELDDLKNHK